MRRVVSGDEDGSNTMTLCGESAKIAVKRRIKLL
jgi:hypothetical protein